MTARWITADVFDGLATLKDHSVDLVVTSPPFLALRSYLPADHADKSKEIGSESTPAEFIDTMLQVTAELRRVLASHGSICIELGDTYAGSGESGWHRPPVEGWGHSTPKWEAASNDGYLTIGRDLTGWPLAKSRTLIPSLYQIALAYGFNPLTGQPSPAGQWRIRNVVTWARPNPSPGALGDKWRPATSDLVVACTSGKRYWDDLATRKPASAASIERAKYGTVGADVKSTYSGGKRDVSSGEFVPGAGGSNKQTTNTGAHPSGAPLLDYWVIPPGGYTGAHYAVFPEELVVPCVQAMCPQKVCRTCGEPSRRIVEKSGRYQQLRDSIGDFNQRDNGQGSSGSRSVASAAGGYDLVAAEYETKGWTDCSHDDYRPGLVLDPFAGSGTTLAVATGHGHDAIGIDLDSRNAELARDRVGPFLFEIVDA